MAHTRPVPRIPKRKASTEPDAAADERRTNKLPKLPIEGDKTHFPFLQLPRELRDEIYRHVIEDGQPAQLKGSNLVMKSGLVGVCEQVCEEFMDAVLFFSPTIRTTVKNHNFAHVVTFINRLSEAQYNKIRDAAPYQHDYSHSGQRPQLPPRRAYFLPGGALDDDEEMEMQAARDAETPKREIIITLSYSPTKTPTTASLNRWLYRFDDPNRRGAELDILYEVDGSTWGKGGYKQRPRHRVDMSERVTAEVRKITQAGERAARRW